MNLEKMTPAEKEGLRVKILNELQEAHLKKETGESELKIASFSCFDRRKITSMRIVQLRTRLSFLENSL